MELVMSNILIMIMAIIVSFTQAGISAEGSIYDWTGEYEFEENIPGDMPRGWLLQVISSSECIFTVEGRQIGFSAKCYLKVEPTKIKVYLDEVTLPDLHFKISKGDLLFTLKLKGAKLETIWGKVKPYYTVGNFYKLKKEKPVK
jgi:hypothetical protein